MAKRVSGRAALQRIRIAGKQFAETRFEPGRVIRDDGGQGGPRCELLGDVLFELPVATQVEPTGGIENEWTPFGEPALLQRLFPRGPVR